MGLKKISVIPNHDAKSIDFRMNLRKNRLPFQKISEDRGTLFMARQALTNSVEFFDSMTVEASRL